MKYIDAEKLIAEIERQNVDKKVIEPLIRIITSLQQEQSDVDLGADIEMEWDSFNKHLTEYGEESEDVVWLNWYNFNELARYFYELGLKARKEE